MPGASHTGPGMPIANRSTAGVVLMFIVIPLLAGAASVWWVVVNAVARSRDFTAGDWFWQVGWGGLLGVGLAVGLPAVGWQELRRRRNAAANRAEPGAAADRGRM